ncbi:MAG: DNA polymerase III subunit alpha, partial [Bacilli bacterium]
MKSHYSILNSLLKPQDIINFALEHQLTYVSMCDINYFNGAIEFLNLALKNKLKPILGLEFNLRAHDINYQLTCYSYDMQGFKNLEKISSHLLMNELVIDLESFNLLKDQLLIVHHLSHSSLYIDYLNNDEHINMNYFKQVETFLTNPHYYFNYDTNPLFYQGLIKAKQDLTNLLMPVQESYYLKQEDEYLLQLLQCLKNNQTSQEKPLITQGSHYLLSKDQAKTIFQNHELQNLDRFLRQVQPLVIPFHNETLPMFKPTHEQIDNHLKKLCLYGLKKRLANNQGDLNTYLKRLNYELEVLLKMGFSNYFLVVYDYVLYAKKNQIMVGPGRGSSAGSLIAYCLGIVDVDPVANNLIFERFLNPERLSLPDIDVDFQDDLREEVIHYLKNKYGHDQVAHIITYGTFQAKNSLRDLARVLEIPNYVLDKLLVLIPNILNIRLVTLLEQSKQVQVLLMKEEKLKLIYHLAIKLEGIIRHSSTHAAGVVILNKSVYEYGVVLPGINETLMIGYQMNDLEQLGIYKMDILGLKNLSIIAAILKDINNEKLNLSKINFNDNKTFKLLSEGHTLGIFQFESTGVIKVLQRMNVDSINDLAATTALFRPGPMRYIDEYIKRKNKQVSYTYLDESLKPILSSTYGIIVYQEQIMKITQVMAGFSLSKADIVRKGMAKKDLKTLQAIQNDFMSNAITRGYSQSVSKSVFEMILEFSNYGFNKAHAYSYSVLAYYMAYLKAHYPQSFFKCLLSANIYSTSKLKLYLYEMKNYDLMI